MTRVYYKEAVGAMVVFDVTRVTTFEAVQKWKNDIDAKVLLPPDNRPIPVVLLANKVRRVLSLALSRFLSLPLSLHLPLSPSLSSSSLSPLPPAKPRADAAAVRPGEGGHLRGQEADGQVLRGARVYRMVRDLRQGRLGHRGRLEASGGKDPRERHDARQQRPQEALGRQPRRTSCAAAEGQWLLLGSRRPCAGADAQYSFFLTSPCLCSGALPPKEFGELRPHRRILSAPVQWPPQRAAREVQR